MKKQLSVRAISVALTILSVASCGASNGDSGNVKGSSKVDMQGAADEADKLIYQTLSMVKPPIEWTHDTSDDGSCDGGSSGYGDVTRRAVVMTKVSEARRGALIGIIERYWKKNGHKITDVNSDKEFPEVYAKTGDDLLQMSLIVGGEGQFFLDVQTACVKKSNVTAPATKANGPSYYGKAIPRPNANDAFWSSNAPIASSIETPKE
ncbi:hypothetical protein [Streptomyces prunicolor]|uniref:hypothetical protein n=1 Tax=Streptomyces prunicolor TaxID=67348 RepID=UPI001FE01694|nr:hypothetical protein [Streptomyces prunicolor]